MKCINFPNILKITTSDVSNETCKIFLHEIYIICFFFIGTRIQNCYKQNKTMIIIWLHFFKKSSNCNLFKCNIQKNILSYIQVQVLYSKSILHIISIYTNAHLSMLFLQIVYNKWSFTLNRNNTKPTMDVK